MVMPCFGMESYNETLSSDDALLKIVLGELSDIEKYDAISKFSTTHGPVSKKTLKKAQASSDNNRIFFLLSRLIKTEPPSTPIGKSNMSKSRPEESEELENTHFNNANSRQHIKKIPEKNLTLKDSAKKKDKFVPVKLSSSSESNETSSRTFSSMHDRIWKEQKGKMISLSSSSYSGE